MKLWWALVAQAACGDNLKPSGSFEIVGHSDLGARGMNSALAVAGDTVYVGSRIDRQPVLIVDVADPAHPTVVGELGAPNEAQNGMSSRELRAVADLNLLVVLNVVCSPQLHGCAAGAEGPENLTLFDITDRRAPQLLASYPIGGTFRAPRDPHEFYLWRDLHDERRVLAFVSEPGAAPQLELLDLSGGTIKQLVAWDAVRDGGLDGTGTDNILHSVSSSPNGKTLYLSHQQGGLVLVDASPVIEGVAAPKLTMITPPSQALDWAPPGMGPHSAVQALSRPLLVVTEEIYPMPFGVGCPWGHLRTVDISDPTQPVVVGEFALPENDPSKCASVPAFTAYTAHNATVTHDLALVTWYAGGLEAIDITDPAHPTRLAELRPEPLPSVTKEDPGLGGNPVEMWSYPVVQDGLIYVVDVRNGLYVLRYQGLHGEQLAVRFREGNSNLE